MLQYYSSIKISRHAYEAINEKLWRIFQNIKWKQNI